MEAMQSALEGMISPAMLPLTAEECFSYKQRETFSKRKILYQRNLCITFISNFFSQV